MTSLYPGFSPVGAMGVGDRWWGTGIDDVGKEMGKERKGKGIRVKKKQMGTAKKRVENQLNQVKGKRSKKFRGPVSC